MPLVRLRHPRSRAYPLRRTLPPVRSQVYLTSRPSRQLYRYRRYWYCRPPYRIPDDSIDLALRRPIGQTLKSLTWSSSVFTEALAWSSSVSTEDAERPSNLLEGFTEDAGRPLKTLEDQASKGKREERLQRKSAATMTNMTKPEIWEISDIG